MRPDYLHSPSGRAIVALIVETIPNHPFHRSASDRDREGLASGIHCPDNGHDPVYPVGRSREPRSHAFHTTNRHAPMATRNPSLHDEICEYNHRLDAALRQRVGITVRTYKAIKAMTQLAGAAAGVYAMWLGADPMTAFVLIAVIVSGPEVAEQILTAQE